MKRSSQNLTAATDPKRPKTKIVPVENVSNPFDGKTFALTGTLPFARKDVVATITRYGGTVAKDVTSRVTHIITADPTLQSVKIQKARKSGVPILDAAWYRQALEIIQQQQHSDESSTSTTKSNDATAINVGSTNDEATVVASETKIRLLTTTADENKTEGPKPRTVMKDGEAIKVSGTSGEYEVRFRGGVYYCTCSKWKFDQLPTDVRTCKHLLQILGDEYNQWRTRGLSTVNKKISPAERKKNKVVPKLLLAKSLNGRQDIVGWWMSEKLDGVRAYWDGKQFRSRQGNILYAPSWFTQGFPDDVTLDGELFGGRKQFQSTVGIVKSLDAGEKWKKLKYEIFDAPSIKKPFEDRLEYLKTNIASVNEWVHIVDQTPINETKDVTVRLAEIESKGGEGVMLRKPHSEYVGSRSDSLLKVKSMHDDEAVVTGYVKGKGKYATSIGSLKCVMRNGFTFNCGSGLNDAERKNPPKIGTMITYQYQELTNDGIPRFPTFQRIKTDATQEDYARFPQSTKADKQ